MNNCGNFAVTGFQGCSRMKALGRIIIVPEYGSDGTKNEFANVAAVNLAALVAMIENPKEKDAIYVLPRVDNVEDLREADENFEWESGQSTFMFEGVRKVTSYIEGTDTALLKRLKSFRNQRFGYYAIDKAGNFIYNLGLDGVTVEPVMIDGNSFSTNFVKPKYKEPGMIPIIFDVRDDMDDGDLRIIPLKDLDFDGRTDDLYGLSPVFVKEVVAPTTALMTIAIATDYFIPIQGATDADFKIHNQTTDTAVTVGSVTESGAIPGQYIVAYAVGVSVADVTKITYKHVKYESKGLLMSAATA